MPTRQSSHNYVINASMKCLKKPLWHWSKRQKRVARICGEYHTFRSCAWYKNNRWGATYRRPQANIGRTTVGAQSAAGTWTSWIALSRDYVKASIWKRSTTTTRYLAIGRAAGNATYKGTGCWFTELKGRLWFFGEQEVTVMCFRKLFLPVRECE